MSEVGETNSLCDPVEKDFHPVQPPDAQHELAVPVISQVSLEEPPEIIEVGDAERVSPGAGGGVHVGVPATHVPPLLQVYGAEPVYPDGAVTGAVYVPPTGVAPTFAVYVQAP